MVKKAIDVMKKVKEEIKKETKKHIATAISAAFALFIALSWDDVIKQYITFLTEKLGLEKGGSFLYTLYSTIIITLICVIAIILVSRWAGKKE